MSLEATIEANTAALHALIAILNAQASSSGERTPSLASATGEHSQTASSPAKAEVVKKSEAPAQDTAQNAASETAATTGSTNVTFLVTRELVLKHAKEHRDAIKAINTKHGIPKLSALLSDENDPTTVTDQAKLNAIHADLLALEV